MSNRTPATEAFVYLAMKLFRAMRHKEHVSLHGGDFNKALGDVQEVENQASECFIMVKTPEGMGMRR